MTTDEAKRVLGLPAEAKPRDIDAAFHKGQSVYVARAQYATAPADRDAANRALGLIQDAYRTLTGKARPSRKLKNRNAHAGAAVRRVSIGSAPTPSAAVTRSSSARRQDRPGNQKTAARRSAPTRFEAGTHFLRGIPRESVAAAAILFAMGAIGLAIVVAAMVSASRSGAANTSSATTAPAEDGTVEFPGEADSVDPTFAESPPNPTAPAAADQTVGSAEAHTSVRPLTAIRPSVQSAENTSMPHDPPETLGRRDVPRRESFVATDFEAVASSDSHTAPSHNRSALGRVTLD